MELTQSKLKEIIKYNEHTGIFKWNKNRGRNAKIGDIAGTINFRGYIVIKTLGKSYKAHRLAFLYMNGKMPLNEVDHINHIKNDNRFINLREANRYDNNRNRRLNKNNKSGTTGVFKTKNNKWEVSIRNNDKLLRLGVYKSKDEAIQIRKAAEVEYGYHINHGKSE